MKKNIYNCASLILKFLPFLAPYAIKIYRNNLGTKFSGWGMKTIHELPWNDEFLGKNFQKTCEDVKHFKFTESTKMNKNTMDELKWRHWIISYATLYSLKFAKTNEYNFVECGVGDGPSSFFTMREISNFKLGTNKFFMHLYDSWDGVTPEHLTSSELSVVGRYSDLDFERTKQNLIEFKDSIVFHKGFIPDSFVNAPSSPDSIVYLHIELNFLTATLETLRFFYPKLVKGGVILFNDYGWSPYIEIKRAIDEFFLDKPGILQKLPTGQAIYYN